MFDLHTVTVLHTAASLLMLVVGVPMLFSQAAGRPAAGAATMFIVLAVFTSASGFAFPFVKFLPSHGVSVIALLTLALTIQARWFSKLRGGWLTVYGIGLALNVYLDAFVGIVQAFLKIPALHALAPTQNSPVFAAVQGVALLAFIVLGIVSVRGLRRGAGAVITPSIPTAAV